MKIQRKRKAGVYAFIDSQNLNLGTSKDIYRGKKRIYKGWKLDFKKFRKYLFDKFRIRKAFLFIGYIKQNEKIDLPKLRGNHKKMGGVANRYAIYWSFLPSDSCMISYLYTFVNL